MPKGAETRYCQGYVTTLRSGTAASDEFRKNSITLRQYSHHEQYLVELDGPYGPLV